MQSYGHQQATVHGGWEKCLGPFDHYQAKAYGIDTWDCHYNNCYVRRDHNGGKLNQVNISISQPEKGQLHFHGHHFIKMCITAEWDLHIYYGPQTLHW